MGGWRIPVPPQSSFLVLITQIPETKILMNSNLRRTRVYILMCLISTISEENWKKKKERERWILNNYFSINTPPPTAPFISCKESSVAANPAWLHLEYIIIFIGLINRLSRLHKNIHRPTIIIPDPRFSFFILIPGKPHHYPNQCGFPKCQD